MDVAAYLSRIGVDRMPAIDPAGLEGLQRAHLTAVPFENLDVYRRRGVATGIEWSVPKIVERGRGGWCFELNGAFAALLEAIGFDVRRRAAVVLLDGDGIEPSHLTLQVELEHPYLVDVGFGDSFIKPLRLDVEDPQDGGCGEFSIVETPGGRLLCEIGDEGSPKPQYRWGPSDRSMSDFDPFSDRLQTDPELRWIQTPFATRLLDGGPDRVTLLHDRIRFRRRGRWQEEAVEPRAWEATLDRWFGMSP